MSNPIRAWKDETYRKSLSVEEQAMLPANPVGEFELTETELGAISGAWDECGGGYNSGGYNGSSSRRPAFNFTFDNDTASSRTQQIVTFEPILGGAVTTFAPTAAQCNNIASPASSSSNLFDFF